MANIGTTMGACVLCISLVLTGCGGGGGAADSPTASNVPPSQQPASPGGDENTESEPASGGSGDSSDTVTDTGAPSNPASGSDTVSPEPAGSGTVLLTLTAKQSAKNAPLRTGVPFPYGAVPSITSLKLETGDENAEIPAQFNALAKWPDGSVKSALVQFVNDIKAEPVSYRLVYGKGVSHKDVLQPLTVTSGAAEITIDTGMLQLKLSASTGLVTSGSRDKDGNGHYDAGERSIDGSDLYLVNAFNNQEYTASRATDAVVTIEENGPVRAVIKATGSMTNAGGERLIKYLVRYYAYRNSDKLDVEYSLIDDRLEKNVQAVRSSLALSLSSCGLRFSYVNSGQAQYRFGGENGAVYSGTVSGERYLYQDGEFVYKTESNSLVMSKSQSYSGVGSGSRAPGWVAVDSDAHHVALMVRDFWQQYPNELNLNGNVLTVALHPGRANGDTPETAPVTQGGSEYKRPKTFYFAREGGAKTYQMRMVFGDATPTDSDLTQNNDLFQAHELLLAAEPAWYTASGVFGDLRVGTSTTADYGYDAYLTRGNLEPSLNKEDNTNLVKLYGWRDYGDRLRPGWAEVINGVRIPSFYNDTHIGSNSFFREYVRTGDARWYSLAETSTRHFMDLDVSHGPRQGYWNTGGLPQPAGEVHAIAHQNVDHQVRNLHWGHAHISGLTDYYLLTGDKRAYDVILEIGNWWKFVTPYFYSLPFDYKADYREAERDYGWPLYVMNEYVRVTGDVQYHKEVAGHLVKYLIGWWQTPADHIGYDAVTKTLSNEVIGVNDAAKGTGFWTMTRAGNYGAINKSTGTTPWMAGSLLGNIILFYEQDKYLSAAGKGAGIEHATMKDMLFQCMNYVVKYGYDDSKTVDAAFVYAETVRGYSGGSTQIVYPLAYLSRLYNTELAAGHIAHPEWYDTSPLWGGIAHDMYDYFASIKAMKQTLSYGFYGYEMVYPMDFFKIMSE